METHLDRTRRPEFVYLRTVNSMYQSRSPDFYRCPTDEFTVYCGMRRFINIFTSRFFSKMSQRVLNYQIVT